MLILVLLCLAIVCSLGAGGVYLVYFHRTEKTSPANSSVANDDSTTTSTTSTTSTDLPPASKYDERCLTDMIANDSMDCFALVYNHCEKDFRDQNRIPSGIRSSKSKILDQMAKVGHKDFTANPKEWTTVCVSRPDKAGKGKCKNIKSDEFRVWAKADGVVIDPCKSSGSLYVKAHFNGDKTIRDTKLGTVGHG